MLSKELAVSGSLRTGIWEVMVNHVIGLTGEGLGLSPGATGICREKTQFICKEEAPNRGRAKGDGAGQGRRETEEERENQGEEEVLGVGEPTQTLSPQDLCQEVGAEARCGERGQPPPLSARARAKAGGWQGGCGHTASVTHSTNWISENCSPPPHPGSQAAPLKQLCQSAQEKEPGTEQEGADTDPGDSQNGPGRAGAQGRSDREAGGDTVRDEEAGAGSLPPSSAFHGCVTLGHFLSLSVPQMGTS